MAANGPGRPGYDPADLLKLYFYGYINRSSRRLEAEAHHNIELIWLLRRLKPDFRTNADFRRVNRSAFKQAFREFAIVPRQLYLFGRELLAVDGTRIKAMNNKDRNFTRGALKKFINEADEKLADYMKRFAEGRKRRKLMAMAAAPVAAIAKSRKRSRRSKASRIVTRRSWMNWTRPARTKSVRPYVRLRS